MNPTRNRRLTFLLGLTVLLAASLSVAATDSPSEPAEPAAEPTVAAAELDSQLFTPAPQNMGECITCEGSYQTSKHWGMGANCNEALQDLEDQTRATAVANCQSIHGVMSYPCNTQLLPDQCWFKPAAGQWVYDGWLAYGCWDGDHFCPEW